MSSERCKNGRIATVVSGLNLESRTIGHNYESVSMDNNFEDVRLTSNTWDTSSFCTSRRTIQLYYFYSEKFAERASSVGVLFFLLRLLSSAFLFILIYLSAFQTHISAVLLYPYRAFFPAFLPFVQALGPCVKNIHTRIHVQSMQVCGLKEAIGGERIGERGVQVGSMNEESQVRDCHNITFVYTNKETVYALP